MRLSRLWGLLPLALLALAVAIRILDPTPIQRMRLVTFDEFQRRAPSWFYGGLRVTVAFKLIVADDSSQ